MPQVTDAEPDRIALGQVLVKSDTTTPASPDIRSLAAESRFVLSSARGWVRRCPLTLGLQRAQIGQRLPHLLDGERFPPTRHTAAAHGQDA